MTAATAGAMSMSASRPASWWQPRCLVWTPPAKGAKLQFMAAFEDVVVHRRVRGQQAACGGPLRDLVTGGNNACLRRGEEEMGRTDLLEGLIAVPIYEVKYE